MINKELCTYPDCFSCKYKDCVVENVDAMMRKRKEKERKNKSVVNSNSVLSDRQKRIYDFLVEHITTLMYSPSAETIVEELKLNCSGKIVWQELRVLEKAKKIKIHGFGGYKKITLVGYKVVKIEE